MRKSVFLLMLIMLVSLTGCDFLRAVAGRPTGKDIEEKRIAIMKAEEKALQARLDSIRLVEEKRLADSLASAASMDNMKAAGVLMSGPSRIGGVSGPELESGYYIIVGAFRDRKNAEKLFNMASEKGYSPVLIECRSGMTAVGAGASDSMTSIEETYARLRQETFCPKEAWILINE